MPFQGVAMAFPFLLGIGIVSAAIYFLLSESEYRQPIPPHAYRTRALPVDDNRCSDFPNTRQASRRNSNRRDRKDNICSICLEAMLDNKQRKLKCGHSFHDACISHWLQERSTCPNCRKSSC